jgi:hypothetical protein
LANAGFICNKKFCYFELQIIISWLMFVYIETIPMNEKPGDSMQTAHAALAAATAPFQSITGQHGCMGWYFVVAMRRDQQLWVVLATCTSLTATGLAGKPAACGAEAELAR